MARNHAGDADRLARLASNLAKFDALALNGQKARTLQWKGYAWRKMSPMRALVPRDRAPPSLLVYGKSSEANDLASLEESVRPRDASARLNCQARRLFLTVLFALCVSVVLYIIRLEMLKSRS